MAPALSTWIQPAPCTLLRYASPPHTHMHIIRNAFRNVCMKAQKFICVIRYRPPKTCFLFRLQIFLLEMVTLFSVEPTPLCTSHLLQGLNDLSARSKFRFDIEVKTIPTPSLLAPPTKASSPAPVPGFHISTLKYPNPCNAVVRNTSSVCLPFSFYVARWYVISLHPTWAERAETNLLIMNPAEKIPGQGTLCGRTSEVLYLRNAYKLNPTTQVKKTNIGGSEGSSAIEDRNLRHTKRNLSEKSRLEYPSSSTRSPKSVLIIRLHLIGIHRPGWNGKRIWPLVNAKQIIPREINAFLVIEST